MKKRIKAGRGVPGRKLLLEFLVRNGISYDKAGEALGPGRFGVKKLSHVAIMQWIKGPNRPLEEYRRRIAEWTRGEVPVESWAQAGEHVTTRPFVSSTGTEG